MNQSALPQIQVDLHSDTQSRPSGAMREAMCTAEVGDEQRGEDPTTRALERKVADLMGMEDAVFLPSGTMCNEIAYRVHCEHGDEIIVDASGHALHFEVGAPAALAGAMIRPLDGERGIFTAEQVKSAIRPANRHHPRSRLLSVENTANLGGGAVWPLEQIRAVCDVAHEAGLCTHLDGARLLNAVVASGVDATDFCAGFDSAWLDLSKGLGAPVGGVLCGSADFIDRAWRFKHQFGGALRQSGIVAAAGIYALDHHVERLVEDHRNATLLARRLADVPGVGIDVNEVETNMVYFDVSETGSSAAQVSACLLDEGVRISPMGEYRMRAVTYLDISEADVVRAGEVVARVLAP